jgi:hypothetical protein
MTSKPLSNKAPAANGTLNVTAPTDGDVEREVAQAVLRPSVQGAATISRWKPVSGDVDIGKLMMQLQEQARLANSGNLARSEAMLIIQAHTLDAIFNNLARRASAAEYLPQFEAYLRLGLKAQSQCRATLETLSEMKNPKPIAFVQQANIANGPQQVNNAANEVPSRAEKAENLQNKLLEQSGGKRLDSVTPGGTVSSDPTLATVGTIDRTAHG